MAKTTHAPKPRRGNPERIARAITLRNEPSCYRVIYAGEPTKFTVGRNENEPAHSAIAWVVDHDDAGQMLSEHASRKQAVADVVNRIANIRPWNDRD